MQIPIEILLHLNKHFKMPPLLRFEPGTLAPNRDTETS